VLIVLDIAEIKTSSVCQRHQDLTAYYRVSSIGPI